MLVEAAISGQEVRQYAHGRFPSELIPWGGGEDEKWGKGNTVRERIGDSLMYPVVIRFRKCASPLAHEAGVLFK